MSHTGAITFRNASVVRWKILKHGKEGKGKPFVTKEESFPSTYYLCFFKKKKTQTTKPNTICCFQGSSTSKFPVFGNVHIHFNGPSLRACLGSVFLAGARLAKRVSWRPALVELGRAHGTGAVGSEGLLHGKQKTCLSWDLGSNLSSTLLSVWPWVRWVFQVPQLLDETAFYKTVRRIKLLKLTQICELV